MKIHISNRQRCARINLARLRRLTAFCLAQARWPGQDFSLVLMDDAAMAGINRLYLDREGSTDVICFALKPRPGLVGAELFVNVQRALQEGRRRRGAAWELSLYLAHGCNHLRGGEDRTAPGRQRMRARELRWLQMAQRRQLLDNLLHKP